MLRSLIVFFIALQNCFVLLAQEQRYSLLSSNAVNDIELRKEFINPPAESRLRCYWWWLNSMATKASITRDLEEMKAKGYGGASIVDAGSSNYTVAKKTKAGPVFMSDDWMALYKHAVKEADRVGIELSVNVQSGWNPGGPSITPELALKKIVYSETYISGGKQVKVVLPQPEKKLFYEDIIVQAFRQPENNFPLKDKAIKNWGLKSFNEDFGFKGAYPLYKLREDYTTYTSAQAIKKTDIVDLANQFSNGMVTWDAPEGNWVIIRYGYTCTGAVTSTNSDGWHGLSLDHLNPGAFNKFSNDVILPLINAAQSAGNSLHFLQTDSWEMGRLGWSNHFASEFKKFRGYDLTPYLPVLAGRIVESTEQSNRFLHDYRKAIGDCIAENHYQLFSDLAHQYGLGIHPESGGPHSAPVDALKVMAISDFPQGEFWATANTHRIKDDERLAVKQSACVAHTNGKRFVAAEGPTSIGPQWERSPKDLKGNIDRVFCSGVNRIVWHTFTSSPPEFGMPGNEYFAGTHMNPNVTWWEQSPDFISYLNRCSYMLSKGLYVADVLYYYGDDVPNFVFLKEEVKDLQFGYDWDKCSKDVILNRLSVKDKALVLPDGMRYRVLVLPEQNAIDPDVLRKVESLVREGLTVVGPRPVKATGLTGYPESDKQVKAIASKMWGSIDGVHSTENSYGEGRVIWGRNINTILAEMKVQPDFAYTSTQANTGIDYIHRTSDNAEIYFVANKFAYKGVNDYKYRYQTSLPNRYEQVECRFRVTGMKPELWDPMTGEIKELLIYKEVNGQTIVPLNLEPEGSRFIVFRRSKQSPHIVQIEKDGKLYFPGNEWNVINKSLVDVTRSGNNITTTLYQPGNYNFTWSDGRIKKHNFRHGNTAQLISGKWDIDFDMHWGAPAHVQTDTLRSWTLFKEEGVKYYSGKAVYKKNFSVKRANLTNTRVILDLGNVLEMASIVINGKKIPVKWSAPFQFDITNHVQPGNNQLEVEVVNLWPNRLIGDGKLPPEKRLTKTNVTKFDGADAEGLLRPSGLLGPVSIHYIYERKDKLPQ